MVFIVKKVGKRSYGVRNKFSGVVKATRSSYSAAQISTGVSRVRGQSTYTLPRRGGEMFIRDAKAIAERLVSQMSPFCRRVQIAGSIRRGRQEVKDYRIQDGALWDRDGQVLSTSEEEDIFRLLRLDGVEPCERGGFAAVKKGGRAVFPAGYTVSAMAARGLTEVNG